EQRGGLAAVWKFQRVCGKSVDGAPAADQHKEIAAARFSVSRNPGNVLADNQSVNVVGALVGDDRFQVHHVAHDGVVFSDAVGAQDVTGDACAFQGHPHVVALGQGDVLTFRLA